MRQASQGLGFCAVLVIADDEAEGNVMGKPLGPLGSRFCRFSMESKGPIMGELFAILCEQGRPLAPLFF